MKNYTSTANPEQSYSEPEYIRNIWERKRFKEMGIYITNFKANTLRNWKMNILTNNKIIKI